MSIKSFTQDWRGYLLGKSWFLGVAVSAAITYFASPPHRLGMLMLVGLIPLFIALDRAPTWKSAAFRGWTYALVFHTAVAWWAALAVHEFMHWPKIICYALVFAISFFEHAYWAVIAGLRHVLHRRFGVHPLFWTPIAFMAMDAAWPKFFPSTIGNELFSMPILKQIADITGAWGLTALLVATNEAGAALLSGSWPRRLALKHALATAMLLSAAFGYGYWRNGQVKSLIAHPQKTVRMALIQPNIGSAEKVIAENGGFWPGMTIVLNQLFSMSTRALDAAPELIVWPETAFPGHYHPMTHGKDSAELTQALDGFVRKIQIPIMTGGYDSSGEVQYNSAFLITPTATEPRIQRYHKVHLFTPAEKVPLIQSLPGVIPFLRARGHAAFTEGDGPLLFDFQGVRLAPAICGEALYPHFWRQFVDLGAQVFVNLTNDSWFGAGREAEIHLQVMAFRSIETRRPIVRVTNTGHTVVIDIDGSFRLETPMDVPKIAIAQVPIYSDSIRSPYMIWGDSWIVLGAAWAAAVWLTAYRRSKEAASGMRAALTS